MGEHHHRRGGAPSGRRLAPSAEDATARPRTVYCTDRLTHSEDESPSTDATLSGSVRAIDPSACWCWLVSDHRRGAPAQTHPAPRASPRGNRGRLTAAAASQLKRLGSKSRPWLNAQERFEPASRLRGPGSADASRDVLKGSTLDASAA